jgi:hypothetical protein
LIILSKWILKIKEKLILEDKVERLTKLYNANKSDINIKSELDRFKNELKNNKTGITNRDALKSSFNSTKNTLGGKYLKRIKNDDIRKLQKIISNSKSNNIHVFENLFNESILKESIMKLKQ